MSDGVALSFLTLVAALIVALALVWPQGEGTPSPWPFGHPLKVAPTILPPLPKNPFALRGPEPLAPPSRH
jgi:hypothetical protein